MTVPRSQAHRGFSLVEVVLALGIVGFAVVAIVGLLPLAVRSARESMEETDATLLARRMHSELALGSGPVRRLSTTGNATIDVLLSSNGSISPTNYFDQDLSFKSVDEALYATRVVVSTNTGIAHLSQVQIEIVSPARVPAVNRTTNVFTTLIHYMP